MNLGTVANRPNSTTREESDAVLSQVIIPPATVVTKFGDQEPPVFDKEIDPEKSVMS